MSKAESDTSTDSGGLALDILLVVSILLVAGGLGWWLHPAIALVFLGVVGVVGAVLWHAQRGRRQRQLR